MCTKTTFSTKAEIFVLGIYSILLANLQFPGIVMLHLFMMYVNHDFAMQLVKTTSILDKMRVLLFAFLFPLLMHEFLFLHLQVYEQACYLISVVVRISKIKKNRRICSVAI